MKKQNEYNLEQSPFHSRTMKLRANLKELKASDGEEVVLARKRYFKQDEYVKFIINNEFNISAYHNLPKMSGTVITYIVYNCLEYNIPTFKFKVEDLATILDVSPSTVFKGLKALITLKYIAKTRSKEIYWINHNMFYKGNFIVDKHVITKK